MPFVFDNPAIEKGLVEEGALMGDIGKAATARILLTRVLKDLKEQRRAAARADRATPKPSLAEAVPA